MDLYSCASQEPSIVLEVKNFLRNIILGTPLERPARSVLRIIRSSRAFPASEESPQDPSAEFQFVPSTFKPINIPLGTTEEELRDTMLSISIDGSPNGALDGYVADSFNRFIHTWDLVRHHKGKCLELGANPYFTTYLLSEHTDLQLTLANYFGGEDGVGTQQVTFQSKGKTKSFTFDFDHFNMEETTFPYEDNSFDLVLYCEIIEHLLMNPIHTLKEINRVLRPGGTLVVTTPNVARLGNVFTIADGRSIYDPYSGHGPYGRHNREYSMSELLSLLEFCGFSHETSFTSDAHPQDHSGHPRFAEVCSLVSHRPDDLGQYLFTSVRKSQSPREGFPGSLYRSYPEEAIDFSR